LGQYFYTSAEYPSADTGGDCNTWEPRDNFAWIADGLSNQFLIGEKHITTTGLGVCYPWDDKNNPVGTMDKPYSHVANDSSYLSMYGFKTIAHCRIFRPGFGIARPYEGTESNQVADQQFMANNRLGFGSWHPDVCQFLMGDGAVRAVSVTLSATIAARLSDVSDGETVSLP